MHYTRHLEQRLNQRGIKKEFLGKLEELGRGFGDKLILSRKNCRQFSEELQKFMKLVEKISKSGGTLSVSQETITAFVKKDELTQVELGFYRIA